MKPFLRILKQKTKKQFDTYAIMPPNFNIHPPSNDIIDVLEVI